MRSTNQKEKSWGIVHGSCFLFLMVITEISRRRAFTLQALAALAAFAVFCSCETTWGSLRGGPVVTVKAGSSQVSEGGQTTFTVTLSKTSSSALTVNYSMSGTAILGTHYTLSGTPGKIAILAGSRSGSATLSALTTNLSSGSETATMTLAYGTGYMMSSPYKASVTISNTANPTPTPSSTPTPTPNPSPSPGASPTATPVPTATPAATPTQHVWIAVRTDGLPGSGTQADPYDGSTAAKFDALMNNFQGTSNLGVHLTGSGPFRTDAHHMWYVGPGWTISGDGMDNTTVQLGGNVAAVRQVACLFSNPNTNTDNVTIANLTVDCNWAELSTTADVGTSGEKKITTGAISLWGSNNLVDHVRSINTYGSWANKLEHFAMFIAGPRTGDGTNNTIQFCRAESPQGNNGNPFALAGWVNTIPYRLITNSKVISCTAVGNNDGLSDGFTSGGVNLANVKDCIIDGNTFTDCLGAAYIDTGSVDGLQVTNNTVTRGWQGVALASWVAPKQNITISGNNFGIQNRVLNGASYGIVVGYATTTNLTVNNNTITFDMSGLGQQYFWGVQASLLNGCTISNNVIGTATCWFGNSARGVAVTLSNNVEPDGSPAPFN